MTCGRYALVLTPEGLQQWIRDPSDEMLRQLRQEGRLIEFRPGGSELPKNPLFASYNIDPTQTAPIITNREGERSAQIARWGLIPSWWREPTPPKFATFNALDDKLAESGMWRGPIRHRRCLVSANGFYEWTAEKGKRIPHWIHREDGAQIAFAGLFDDWTNPETGEAVTSYSIITTAPNSLMTRIHDRMPVILQDTEAQTLWLDLATDTLDGVKHLLVPQEWEGFEEYEVAPLKGDGPESIERT